MTTREDKLKKLNAELEQLTDDELDEVAGGTIGQTAGDSKILYDYGLMDRHYGTIPVMFYWKSKSAEVDAGWAKAGITCVTKPFGSNQYFLNGKEISQDDAWKIIDGKENFIKNKKIPSAMFVGIFLCYNLKKFAR